VGEHSVYFGFYWGAAKTERSAIEGRGKISKKGHSDVISAAQQEAISKIRAVALGKKNRQKN
jgi:hypothetical protein